MLHVFPPSPPQTTAHRTHRCIRFAWYTSRLRPCLLGKILTVLSYAPWHTPTTLKRGEGRTNALGEAEMCTHRHEFSARGAVGHVHNRTRKVLHRQEVRSASTAHQRATRGNLVHPDGLGQLARVERIKVMVVACLPRRVVVVMVIVWKWW